MEGQGHNGSVMGARTWGRGARSQWKCSAGGWGGGGGQDYNKA